MYKRQALGGVFQAGAPQVLIVVIAVGGPHPQAQLAVFQHHDLVAVPFVDIRVDVEELPALVRLAGGHEEQGLSLIHI